MKFKDLFFAFNESRPINFKIVPDFPFENFSNFLVQNLVLDR
jgi:hypothetical protein